MNEFIDLLLSEYLLPDTYKVHYKGLYGNPVYIGQEDYIGLKVHYRG